MQQQGKRERIKNGAKGERNRILAYLRSWDVGTSPGTTRQVENPFSCPGRLFKVDASDVFFFRTHPFPWKRASLARLAGLNEAIGRLRRVQRGNRERNEIISLLARSKFSSQEWTERGNGESIRLFSSISFAISFCTLVNPLNYLTREKYFFPRLIFKCWTLFRFKLKHSFE